MGRRQGYHPMVQLQGALATGVEVGSEPVVVDKRKPVQPAGVVERNNLVGEMVKEGQIEEVAGG